MPREAQIITGNNIDSNYTLTKLIRTGTSPLLAMIGTSSYYSQIINNPILGAINSFLFAKKLGIDIWNLNQMPNKKTKLFNSSKKILLGLGTISLANYSKFINTIIEPIIPTDTPYITSTIPSSTTTLLPWSTLHPASTISTTTIDPWPDPTTSSYLLNKLFYNNINNSLMDWDTYISLNSYGISNLIAGITELIPNRFETIRKIANMATGGTLISSGVAMGINNNFNNAYAIPTIVAGASEIIHNLLPMDFNFNNTELQETTFTNVEPLNDETVRLINENTGLPNHDELQWDELFENADNSSINNEISIEETNRLGARPKGSVLRTAYGSNESVDRSLNDATSNILFQKEPHEPIYKPTTVSI